MLHQLRVPVLASLLLLLIGCAGEDFVRPNPETLRLGHTTYAEIIQQMGKPRKTLQQGKDDKKIKSVFYVYSAPNLGDPLEDGVTPVRVQSYFFHNDVLVGHQFMSTFASDHTNFDETKVAAISKGKTSRAEIIQLVGRPSGIFAPPMVKEPGVEEIAYLYTPTRRSLFGSAKHTKNLIITFDDQDRVLDVNFKTSDLP